MHFKSGFLRTFMGYFKKLVKNTKLYSDYSAVFAYISGIAFIMSQTLSKHNWPSVLTLHNFLKKPPQKCVKFLGNAIHLCILPRKTVFWLTCVSLLCTTVQQRSLVAAASLAASASAGGRRGSIPGLGTPKIQAKIMHRRQSVFSSSNGG